MAIHTTQDPPNPEESPESLSTEIWGRNYCQKAADVCKTDVWDFRVFSQTFLELRFSLGNKGKDSENLNSQTWPGTPRRPSPRHPRPSDTELIPPESLQIPMRRGEGLKWAMFRKPQPLQLVQKVRQYTSNLYGSASPICIAVLSWLLTFEERETLQYASHLYCSTPPICTAVLLEKYWGLGSPERF